MDHEDDDTGRRTGSVPRSVPHDLDLYDKTAQYMSVGSKRHKNHVAIRQGHLFLANKVVNSWGSTPGTRSSGRNWLSEGPTKLRPTPASRPEACTRGAPADESSVWSARTPPGLRGAGSGEAGESHEDSSEPLRDKDSNSEPRPASLEGNDQRWARPCPPNF